MAENNETRITLAGAFSRALTRSLTESCGGSWETGVSENAAASAPDPKSSACFRFSLSGDLAGNAFLVVSHTDALVLGLRDVEDDSLVFEEEHATAMLVALQAGAAELKDLLVDYGTVAAQVESSTAAELPKEPAVEIWARTEDSVKRVTFLLYLDEQMMSPRQSASAHAASESATKTAAKANLDLVMDVELNVTLRFGQRRLSLREVLDLTSGSVVELDRQVDEPVELVLDGRVVARGDAVIIDGNYGIRITQVVQHVIP